MHSNHKGQLIMNFDVSASKLLNNILSAPVTSLWCQRTNSPGRSACMTLITNTWYLSSVAWLELWNYRDTNIRNWWYSRVYRHLRYCSTAGSSRDKAMNPSPRMDAKQRNKCQMPPLTCTWIKLHFISEVIPCLIVDQIHLTNKNVFSGKPYKFNDT